MTRMFPVATALTVTTGVQALAPIEEVQRLLAYMTGDEVFYHQIPRAADICGKYLQDQHAWLATTAPTARQAADPDKLSKWLRDVESLVGKSIPVMGLPGDAYTSMDPIVEFVQQLGASGGVGLASGDT